mmetsp:Transcript_25211/g.74073  ORF Transcript_25211/g.74073 Transcript_25211/m.74073 type:complete len:228 (-) Transcript_25211:1112-1795(-)
MSAGASTSESVRRHYASYVSGGGDGESVLTTPGRGSDLGYDLPYLESLGLRPSKEEVDDDADVDVSGLFSASCGSGCPLRLPGGPRAGESVCDLGCGAGHDVALASRIVGPGGRVVGVDLTEEMIDAARKNVRSWGCNGGENATLVRAAIDGDRAQLEERARCLERDSMDAVLSNGVVNLCDDKRAAFEAAFWMLKPGGRFLLSDLCRVEENADVRVSCSVGDGWSS